MSFSSLTFLVVSGGTWLLLGCQSPTTELRSPGYEYFPLETGRYIIYDVQETNYALKAVPNQRTYQLKEVVGPVYTDVTGQLAYQLIRYRRTTANGPWQADSVWSARIVNNEALRTENGQDFVKLVFPISDRLTWNTNRHNGVGLNQYEVRNIGQPYRVLDKQFDETVTVIGQDDSTLVSQEKQIDVYAPRVGLIYKEQTQVQFCTSTQACVGQHQIEYGTQQIYRVRTYGKE